MKKIKQILEYISTVDFLAVLIAIFTLSLCTSAYWTMFNPKGFDRVYQMLFAYSVISFTVSYLILKPLENILLSKLPINLMWFFVITLGSFGFSSLLIKPFGILNFPSNYFEFFFGFILLALVLAAIFRFTMNFAISFWQERRETPISIVN